MYRMILHSALKGCVVLVAIWKLALYQLLCTWHSDPAAGKAEREAASGLPSVPQNNPLLAGDELSKIYKTPSQKPQLNFLIAILEKKKKKTENFEVASGFGVLT